MCLPVLCKPAPHRVLQGESERHPQIPHQSLGYPFPVHLFPKPCILLFWVPTSSIPQVKYLFLRVLKFEVQSRCSNSSGRCSRYLVGPTADSGCSRDCYKHSTVPGGHEDPTKNTRNLSLVTSEPNLQYCKKLFVLDFTGDQDIELESPFSSLLNHTAARTTTVSEHRDELLLELLLRNTFHFSPGIATFP